MAREGTGTILERNGKFYARIRFKDELGNQRDIRRVAESRSGLAQFACVKSIRRLNTPIFELIICIYSISALNYHY
jgi:hypothetical protein